MIGDRALDVLTGINASGKGVFISSDVKDRSLLHEAEDLRDKYGTRVYIASSFLEAAEWIRKEDENNIG